MANKIIGSKISISSIENLIESQYNFDFVEVSHAFNGEWFGVASKSSIVSGIKVCEEDSNIVIYRGKRDGRYIKLGLIEY